MQLSGKMLSCINFMIYTEMTKKEIAERLDVSASTISRWQDRDDFQDALREEMYRAFGEMAMKARRRLETLMESKNDGVAFAACKEVLNKAGYQEIQRIEGKIDNTIKVDVVDD